MAHRIAMTPPFGPPRMVPLTHRPISKKQQEFTSNSLPSFTVSHGDDDDSEELLEFESLQFDEDTFSLSIGLLVRDMHFIAEEHRRAREEKIRWWEGTLRLGREETQHAQTGPIVTRLVSTTWMLLLTCALQLYLLYSVKHMVSAKAVHDMRLMYDSYEIHMYGNNVSQMDVTPNGLHRGRLDNFQPSSFDTLPAPLKDAACCIPLSQPAFFFSILFMWSVCGVGELMKIWRCFYCLLVQTQTVLDMADCRSGSDALAEEDVKVTRLCAVDKDVMLIRGVTWKLKLMFAFCFFIPRICLTLYILWLGCRYLCATADFAAVLLNALAFKFILNLKEIMYFGLAPIRTRVHLASLRMLPERYSTVPGHDHLRHVILVTAITALWVWTYMVELQAVIPDYRWDVHGVCVNYLLTRYAV